MASSGADCGLKLMKNPGMAEVRESLNVVDIHKPREIAIKPKRGYHVIDTKRKRAGQYRCGHCDRL
jgi:hypothetical protein